MRRANNVKHLTFRGKGNQTRWSYEMQIITSVSQRARKKNSDAINPGSHTDAHAVQTWVNHTQIISSASLRAETRHTPTCLEFLKEMKAHLASRVCRRAWRQCGRGRCAALSSGRSPRPWLGSRTAAGGRSSASLCSWCCLGWRKGVLSKLSPQSCKVFSTTASNYCFHDMLNLPYESSCDAGLFDTLPAMDCRVTSGDLRLKKPNIIRRIRH